jgi:hypothetical protein
MADQSHHLPPLLHSTASRPSVRPLPLEDVQRATGPYVDSANVLRTALFGGGEGWFDAYWYGQQSGAKPRMLPRLIRRLRGTIAAIGVIRHVRKGASGVGEHHVPEAMAAQNIQ